jgi:hypothetical protein
MLVRKWFIPLIGFMVLGIVTGCSGGGSGSLATVSGVVTQNGAPLDGAKVTLYSTVESEGKKSGSYSAMTDSSGKYVISSVGKEPGIPPGMYKVTITKLQSTGNLPADFDAGQVAASGMAKNVVSQEYESLATTKLSVTLEAGKNPDKNFDVKPSSGAGTRISGVP